MDKQMETILSQLSLEQKAGLLQGWSSWTTLEIPQAKIPACFLSDGPHGLRKQAGPADHLGINDAVPATCFPTAATMANSWDPALGEELGRALGEEAAANDVHVVLGPGLNIKRNPLCGRNFEYFSEDPYLAGKMAAAYIRGIQAMGPAACPKHFAANSQELRRMAMDAVVDERTLREIYLTGFEIAVKEGGAKTIMSAYNMVNGTYANENAHLLRDILRGEWGFDGFVVSDWGADNDHVAGVNAGSNLVMPDPGAGCAMELVAAVQDGTLEEAVLDQRLRELLGVLLPAYAAVAAAPKTFDQETHHALARRCAAESIVLLENDGILPLQKGAQVAIIGEFAKEPRYQGAGSSKVNPTKMDAFYDQAVAAGLCVTGYAPGFDRRDPAPRQALIDEAVQLASHADTVLLCVGLDEIAESEGMDRMHMHLSPGQTALIEAVCRANANVILVLSGGSPFVMPKKGSYRAAIHGYLSGQAGAGAMADAILGNTNPSGKLNETWPEEIEECPSAPYFPSPERTSEYREGLFVGYRYFDTANVPVRYPFGYGLSYTSFAYSNLQATEQSATFTITNTGAMAGAEVAQVYVSCKCGNVFRPRKELKGFTKVFLEPGQSRTVTVPLDDKAFRYFNPKTNAWQVEGGEYEIHVAASVADVKLTAIVQVAGTDAPSPYGSLPSYESGNILSVPDEEYEALLGRPIPDGHWQPGALQPNDALCQLYTSNSRPAQFVYSFLTRRKEKAEASGIPDLNILFIYNMPFRAMSKLTNGRVSREMAEDVRLLFSGHFFRGVGRFVRDFFRNRKASAEFIKKL